MEIKKKDIIEAVGGIIAQSGLRDLSIKKLSLSMGMDARTLSSVIGKDEEIYLILLNGLEQELSDLFKEISKKNQKPEQAIQILFKELFVLFSQKPFYLSIIFDETVMAKDAVFQKSVLRIKKIAEAYLFKLIEEGKNEKTFKTGKSTQTLVKSILSGFRLFMKDEQLINDMILELKTLRTLKD